MKRWIGSLFLMGAFATFIFLQSPPLTPNHLSATLQSLNGAHYTSEIESYLLQPYKFLSRGKQVYAFASADGQYVLKFFDQAYHKIPWYLSLPLPKSFKEKVRAKRGKREFYYLTSYKLAYDLFKKETGLLFIHTGKTEKKLPSIQVALSKTRTVFIDLDQTPFVLQTRAKLIYPALLDLYKEGGLVAFQEGIEQFLAIISKRIERGVADEDHNIEDNFGYLSGSIQHIDPGRYILDPTLKKGERRKKEWWSSTHRMRRWLEETVPEALPFFDQKLNSYENRPFVEAE